MRMRRLLPALLMFLALVLVPQAALAQTSTGDPYKDTELLNERVAAAITALAQNNVEQARAEYAALDNAWFEVEDGIREASRDAYREIESAMGDVKFALKQEPVDTAEATKALQALKQANDAFISTAGTTPADQPAAASTRTLAGELPALDEALAAIQAGDLQTAGAEVEAFRAAWPDVEAVVAAKDGAVYKQAEDLQAQAAAEIKAGQSEAAATTLTTLRSALQPFASETLRYGVFDATSILLREGLEALLVIAALLAFLQKSGNADKRRWIWLGGAAGIVASVLVAIAIQMIFSAIVTGTNRELIEGITGLIAAGLLFYVSYWLHSKTHIGGWQRYLKDKTSAALAKGSLFSLATLAFLSVFREGAETTLFYLGIASSIALRDLLIGLGLGTVLLVIVGALVIGLGKRIPLKPFFQVTSLLIWYLGFKFIGTGIQALQVARIVPETNVSWLPTSDLLGVYPTLETTLPQLLLVVLAIAVVLWTRSVATKQAATVGATVHS